MKIRVPELFSLIFGNGLLVTCTFSLFWYWKYILCGKYDNGCHTAAILYAVLSAFVCILPLLLWVIFTIYAVVSNKKTDNRRTTALRFALFSMPCLLLVWIIAAFISSYALPITATLLCIILMIMDILYVRAVLLEHKL